jgi:DNA-binding NarL/FixJ family response regulator
MRLEANFLLAPAGRTSTRRLVRRLSRFGVVHEATTQEQAWHELGVQTWTGVIIDTTLATQETLQLVVALQRARPRLASAVLVAPGNENLPVLSRALELADVVVHIGTLASDSDRFARYAIASAYLSKRPALGVAQFGQDHDLPAMETRVVALRVACVPRREWSRQLGVSGSTIKTYTHRLLSRAGERNLDAIADPIKRAVLTDGAASTLQS